MRVLIPSIGPPLWTGGDIVPLESGDDESYWRFWQHVWAQKQTTIVVEHDVVPSTIALKSLWSCPYGWCTQPYTYIRMPAHRGLGCVKFSGTLMGMYPDLWEIIADKSDIDHPPKHWCRLDKWSAAILTDYKVTRHDHHLQVRHPIRERSAHGCV